MGQFDNLKMARSEITPPGDNHFTFFLDTENAEAPTVATGTLATLEFMVLPYAQTQITAPVLSANADDWTFEEFPDAHVVRIAASVPGVKITGLKSSDVPPTARRKLFLNVGDETIRFSDQDGDSLEANQFLLFNGAGDIDVAPGDALEVLVDVTDEKWRNI